MPIKRVILIIVDALGIGELPDAVNYDDRGAATIQHMAETVGGLHLPTCQKLGLGNITPIKGVPPVNTPVGAYGKMAEKSPGKDSTTGHWEIGGVILDQPFPVFPDGFPDSLIKDFESKAGIQIIGNIPASGTEIIERLGEEHLRTKKIILYTSADSVFQLAAHESLYPLDRLYEICQVARDLCIGQFNVGRVIARPFIGKPGSFTRTSGRRDFSVEPPEDTILDLMYKNNHPTLAIGKIYDLFAGRGVSDKIKTATNDDGMRTTTDAIINDTTHNLIFTNLVDGDQLWGHRRDSANFAKSIEQFDRQLADLLNKLRNDDLLIITADHGCDPTYMKHTDHTREYIPLLAYHQQMSTGYDLGIRESFTDIGKTIADIFSLNNSFKGTSFKSELSS